MTLHISVDIGGTFTDAIVYDEKGRILLSKVPSTPSDPVAGVLTCLRKASRSLGMTLEEALRETEMVVHGGTVGTNLVVQHRGARVALLTTSGFRDIVEMRRGHREPPRYNLKMPPPEQLCERRLRFEIDERVDAEGKVVRDLDLRGVKAAVEHVRKSGADAVAVGLLFSFLNPTHEAGVKKILEGSLPGVFISVSSEVLPQIREYERFSTTVMNAYVGPTLSRYFRKLEADLHSAGYKSDLQILQCNGGMTKAELACLRPVTAILSGTVAGPIASSFYGAINDLQHVIYMEMGGTTFEVSLLHERRPSMRMGNAIGGYYVGMPTIDIHTIGAGGGSIAWMKSGVILDVGPHSAGASPGPVCYDKGGTEPTVTDANLVLGYLNPDYFLGGEIKLKKDLSTRAIEEKIARPMGWDTLEAAYGIFKVINSKMADALQTISVQRGYDPRDFALIIGGGAGPVHGAKLAEEIGSSTVLVPRLSSGFDCFGMLLSDLRHDYVRTYVSPLEDADWVRIGGLFQEMSDEASTTLDKEGVPAADRRFTRILDMRYKEQVHEIEVEVPAGKMNKRDIGAVSALFHRRHEQLYTYSEAYTPVEIVNLRLTALGVIAKPKLPRKKRDEKMADSALKERREVFFDGKLLKVQVYDPKGLSFGNKLPGPAIIEEAETTVVIPPGWRADVNRYGDYLLVRERSKT